MEIPWYTEDPRFTPGTVADIGEAFRLTLNLTRRKQGTNKWHLYLAVRTLAKHGVKDDLKRDVCVAAFPGTISLETAQEKAEDYLCDFLSTIITDLA